MTENRSSRVSNKIIIGVVVGLLLVVTVGVGVASEARGQASNPATESDEELEVAPFQGAIAPDFELETIEGEVLRLSDFRGQPVLINLWATWCGPCRLEMPAFQDRFERFEDDGFTVLAVNFDEGPEDIRAFQEELGLTFELLLDPGAEVQRLYLNRTYPSSFFVDSDGIIAIHHIGVMTEGQLDGYLQQLGLEG